MTVEYWIEDGYPIERVGTNFEATIRYRCAWEDRYQLLASLVGVYYSYNNSTDALPRSARIDPDGVIDEDFNYEHALVTVEFSNAVRKYSGTHFMSEEFVGSKEIELLDYQDFTWSDGTDLTQGESPRMVIPMVDIRTSFFNISTVPAAAISLMGCVNAAVATSYTTGMSFAAQTLFYDTFDLKADIYLGCNDGYRLEYVFHARPVSWNLFWNPNKSGGAGWDSIKIKSSGDTYLPHTPTNLSALVPA